MRTKPVYFGMLLLTLIALFSFTEKEQTPDFITDVYSRFYSYLENFREEKVYLHTDKPYYSAGDTIWFKGYLVNVASRKPESLSGFIYVELINREDDVVQRVKIRRDSTGFAGYISLDQTFPSGEYNLRAYSQWMQNNATDFFFNKNISIGNRIEERVNFQTNYGAVDDGKVLVEIKFADENMNPIADRHVEIYGRWPGAKRNRIKKISLTTNSIGGISFDLPIDTTSHEQHVLDLLLSMEDYNFETKIYLPDFSNDFDVQFFPESGTLLALTGVQPLAFKAIGTDGLSREISGKLYSQDDEELLEFKSDFNGMGKILLNTIPGQSYYVIVESESRIKKRFEIPKMENEGVSLHLNFHSDKIYYKITNQLIDQSIPLYLLIHSSGVPFIVSPIKKTMGQISGLNFETGIFVISVVDSLGNVYGERLFFRNTQSSLKTSMRTDQKSYGKRDLVNLSFKVQSQLDQTLEGFYSLSVTDSHFVKSDTINDNIISHLLLSSDLKGHIENPTSYFIDDSISSHQKLDLLMLTQGWSRYNTSDLLKDKVEIGDHYLEVGQTLSGKVVNVFGRPVKNCDVLGLVNSSIITTKTDSLGQYVFDGIGFQDSVTFLLKAERKKSILDVEIIPDVQVFPPSNSHMLSKSNEQWTTPDEYLNQSRQKFFNDGGISHIYLDEFTVKARRKEHVINENYLGIMADVISSEKLDKMRSMDLLMILRTLPGVMVTGNNVTIRNNPGPPILIVDGVTANDFSEIQDIITDDVDNIQILKGATASFFGAGSSNGVIAINTKRGEVNRPRTPISMTTVTPLGFQKPKQFYVPKYEVKSIRDNENPDLRTTIYWNPYLSSDSSGMINVEFYTADQANDYSVVLEGVTKAGEICRYQGTINRN